MPKKLNGGCVVLTLLLAVFVYLVHGFVQAVNERDRAYERTCKELTDRSRTHAESLAVRIRCDLPESSPLAP